MAQESLRGQRARPGSEAGTRGPSGWSGGDKAISANDGRLGCFARFQKQVSGKIISKTNSRRAHSKPTHLPERAGTQPPKFSCLMDHRGPKPNRRLSKSAQNLQPSPQRPGEPAHPTHSSVHLNGTGEVHPLFLVRRCLHKGRHTGKPTQTSGTGH